MRLVRTIGWVLTLWAVAAIAFSGLGVRAWFRTPSPAQAELRERSRERGEELVLWAGTAGVACLALASLAGLRNKPRPAGSGATVDRGDSVG